MPDNSDPRVFFSAERTLLAWLRTGIAIITLGFVVARFGLFLREIGRGSTRVNSPIGSAGVGVILVVLGCLSIFGAAAQHVRFCRRLPVTERPVRYWSGFALWVSLATATAGAVLAGILAMS